MAKTAEQKALNKIATQLRNKAYRNRRGSYLSEINAMEAALKSSQLHAELMTANDKIEAAIKARSEAESEIEKQIWDLQKKLATVKAEHNKNLDAIKEKQKIARDNFYSAKNQEKRAIDEKYSDIANCWGAADWKPIEEFLDEAANAAGAGNADNGE